MLCFSAFVYFGVVLFSCCCPLSQRAPSRACRRFVLTRYIRGTCPLYLTSLILSGRLKTSTPRAPYLLLADLQRPCPTSELDKHIQAAHDTANIRQSSSYRTLELEPVPQILNPFRNNSPPRRSCCCNGDVLPEQATRPGPAGLQRAGCPQAALQG
jgi:hypothetical protein